jgi:hypothetical protein
VEDETDLVQLICVDAAIDLCTPVFLTSQAVIVEGVIQRKGKGATLMVERAALFRPEKLAGRARQIGAYSGGAEIPAVVQ